MIYHYVLAYDFSTAQHIHHVPYLHLARRMPKKIHASESGSDSQCRSETDSVCIYSVGTCVEFGPTQLPVGLGLGLGLRLGLGLGLRLGLGLGLRLELGLGLGLGPNLIDRKLGGPEPDTSAILCYGLYGYACFIIVQTA